MLAVALVLINRDLAVVHFWAKPFAGFIKMATRPNRATRLPEHLWDKREIDLAENEIRKASPASMDVSSQANTKRQAPFLIPIPVKTTDEQSSSKAVQQAREGSIRKILHIGSPSQKYLICWKIEQAGGAWIGLENSLGYSKVLIKKEDTKKKENPTVRSASHRNVVELIEAFKNHECLWMIYRYNGFAIDLSLVFSSPHVQASESDLATICKSILSGLEYIHNELRISHGAINLKNVLLFEDGRVRIGINPRIGHLRVY